MTPLKIAAAAAGITLVLCVAAASALRYAARPTTKPWDDKALIVVGPPGFGSYSDTEYRFYLTYSVQNTSGTDWAATSPNNLRLVSILSDGSSNPILKKQIEIRTPTFIPSKQLGTITLQFMSGDVPKQSVTELEGMFHERLRRFLNENYATLKGFVLFDDTSRIQINLPTWSRTKPENAGEVSSEKDP